MVDSKRFSCGKCVLICRQELELPIVHGLLVFDAFFDILRRMLTTRVFQAICDNDAEVTEQSSLVNTLAEHGKVPAREFKENYFFVYVWYTMENNRNNHLAFRYERR